MCEHLALLSDHRHALSIPWEGAAWRTVLTLRVHAATGGSLRRAMLVARESRTCNSIRLERTTYARRVSPRGRPPRLEVYQRLEVQIAELWQRMGGLPNPQEAADIWRGIWFEEAHHSTAIEGNTLVLKQVEQLLAEGRAVGNKELSEYLEVKGYADAAEWVYGQAIEPDHESDELLNLTELRRVHSLAMQPVWDVAPHPNATDHEGPGDLRRHDIPGGDRGSAAQPLSARPSTGGCRGLR